LIFSEIKVNDVIISNPVEIATIFNKYFSTVGENLVSRLPNKIDDLKNFLPPSQINSFQFYNISTIDIATTINSPNNSYSLGPDNFSSSLLKLGMDRILLPLQFIFNNSFLQDVFPDCLKTVRVLPLFKKGSKSEISNYRPIAISSSFSKVFEKIVYKRMSSFLNKFNILYDYQFGFRESYSTSLALFEVLETINTDLNNNNLVLGLFIDM